MYYFRPSVHHTLTYMSVFSGLTSLRWDVSADLSPHSVFQSGPPLPPFIASVNARCLRCHLSLRREPGVVQGQEEMTRVWQEAALETGEAALFNFALLCVQEHTLAHQHKQIQRLTLFLFTLMNKEISKKMGLLRGFTDPKPPKDVNTRFICWDWTAAIQSKTDDLIFQTSSRDNYKPIQLITSSIRITRLAHTLKTSF